MSSTDVLEDPLEVVEFLARSPNRVNVLDLLTNGPYDRYALEEETGVSRATLGRILEDFEERNWVLESDRTYQTTPLGAYVAETFMDLLQRFEPIPSLNEVAQWFPEEGFDFDLGCLAGAEVVRPSKREALAPTNHIAKRLRTSERVRLLTYAVLPNLMEVCWRGTVDGTLELVSILDHNALERLATDPQVTDRAREMIETGQAEIVVYDGEIPSTVFIVDETVLLCLSGGEGAPQAVIETDDETVLSWAESTIEDYRREGQVLDPGLITG